MAFEGDVETFPLGDVFAWLTKNRATGILTLSRGMTIRRFHLRAGQIRLVSSSEQEMLLGHLLVERKLVTPEGLANALSSRGQSRARLGRVLMRGGLVAPKQLREILEEKVRRLLGDALTWSEGRFLFQAPEVRPGEEGKKHKARRGEMAVAVDLKGALEQLQSKVPPDLAGQADDRDVVVDDSDVLESLPVPLPLPG